MSDIRTTILEADDLVTEVVDVPEWKQKVSVRALTAAEKDAYTTEVMDIDTGKRSWKNATSLLVVRTVVDDSGERVFSDKDAAALGKKNAAAVGRLFNAAMRLSGLSQEDVEELVEDFDNAQTDDSATN